MDKRSLLFLACITLSYFGLHVFFGTADPKGGSLENKAAIERSEKMAAVENENDGAESRHELDCNTDGDLG